MQRGKPKLTALWHALDEAAFGSERTLNLRESLPSAAEARNRTENWLRGRQLTKSKEVLIITGRGNQSAGGVGVIRQEILGMMPSLKRRGVVASWREHSPGSIVVTLAPVSALFSVGKRRRGADAEKAVEEMSFAGIGSDTLIALRQLAINNLDSLGVEHGESFLKKEMIRVFSALMSSLPPAQRSEETLRVSIQHAIDESSDDRGRKL